MKMKRKRLRCDDPPVKLRFVKKAGRCSEVDLLKRQPEKCEFCDEVFFNKYSVLVHNANHIIIPLQRQKMYQCPDCLYHFTSSESLGWHTFKHHPNLARQDYAPQLLQSFIKKEPLTVLVNESFDLKKEVDHDNDTLLQSFVRKEAVTVLTKDPLVIKKEKELKILQSFVKKEAITVIEPMVVGGEIDMCYNRELSQNSSIKDRITFEDDEDDIFLTNYVNIVDGGAVKDNGVQEGVRNNSPHLEDKSWTSIHYDELMSPGEYACRTCSGRFPNRYQLILHENKHIRFKRRIPFLCKFCDWYVSSNPWGLKDHIQARHGDHAPVKRPTRSCSECGLKFIKHHRHMRNYHHGQVTHQERHVKRTSEAKRLKKWYTKWFKVCELCSLFLKSKSNANYELISHVNKVGRRESCQRCEKSFFDLKLVKLRYKRVAGNHKQEKEKKERKMTNEDRLKMVKQRLKKLKQLNKY